MGGDFRDMSRILHVCAGWEPTNGAASIARLFAAEQRARGDETKLATWVSPGDVRRADEVWIHCGWLPCLWWATLCAALCGKRQVRVPEACYDPVRLAYHGWKKCLVRPIERWCLRRAAAVVATCAEEVNWVRRYEPKAAVEIADIKKFFPLPEKTPERPGKIRRLLYLGRRHPLKGLAFLERAVEGLGVELRIESSLDERGKDAAFEWCDALVLPTLSDNFGVVVAEALVHGRHAIVTDGAGAWRGQAGVTFVEGFRDAADEERVALLRRAIAGEAGGVQ